MGWGGRSSFRWGPYVSVGQKLAKAVKKADQEAKKQERERSPVKIEGKKIATTFWGKAWCDNLTAYSDYSNRLPRGATYVRNGSVVDLVIKSRTIEAIVAGSETYTVKIEIATLEKAKWKTIKRDCSASIDSLLDLLAGRFSDGTMQRLTHQKDGLFPSPREIKMKCSCPDSSECCKHLAAVMYGVGARLDKQPELLFLLRDVDHQELVSEAFAEGHLDKELSAAADGSLEGQDLGAIFGIELDATTVTPPKSIASTPRRSVGVTPSQKSKTTTLPRKKTKPNVGFSGIATPTAALVKSDVVQKLAAKKLTTKKLAATKLAPKKLASKKLTVKKLTVKKLTVKKLTVKKSIPEKSTEIETNGPKSKKTKTAIVVKTASLKRVKRKSV